MEALECIKTRRSIRKFTEQPVTEDEVRQVVEAAAFAPSWKNTQIARYIVVTDQEKKDKLADNCMLGLRARRLVQYPACHSLAVL